MGLINREDVYDALTEYYHHKTQVQHDALRDALSQVPDVDAVEIVQCKNCIWWDKYPSSTVLNFHECHAHMGIISTQAFEYCYRGERKEDA